MARAIWLGAAAVLTSFALVVSAQAQSTDASDKSAEELQEMFKEQKTRGLAIAPAAGGSAPAATATATTGTTTTLAAKPVATDFTPVAEGTEVNIRISFDFDSALLRDDQKPRLGNMCAAIKAMDSEVFRIVGHTDAKGSDSYNEKLSLLRAKEVKRYLVSSCGIDETRLEAVGAGETHPANASNPNADENRRVEFQLIS